MAGDFRSISGEFEPKLSSLPNSSTNQTSKVLGKLFTLIENRNSGLVPNTCTK